MATKTRLDKAINGLKNIVERNKQDKYIFSKDTIVIGKSSPHYGAILLLSLILLLPIGLVIYYFIVDKSSSSVFWLLLLELILLNDFYKLLLCDTILTINFKEKYVCADNTLSIVTNLFPDKKIPFSELTKVDLQKKSISWQQQWYQLVAFDKSNNSIVLTGFNKSYPESFIATKVKFLIEVIIWTEKQTEFSLLDTKVAANKDIYAVVAV